MKSITKTFGAMALGAAIAGGGTAYYYEDQNDKREAAELTQAEAERNSISPVTHWTIQGGEYIRYYYKCAKDNRFAVVEYPDEQKERNSDGEYEILNLDREAQIIIQNGLRTIYEEVVDLRTIGQARNVAEHYCQTGEFDNPTTPSAALQ